MNHTLENEVLCRKQSEIQCIAREESLAWAKKQIQSLEQRIQDMDETCQLKIREVKDLETQLQQVKGQQHKSESKYEQALIEIESCK